MNESSVCGDLFPTEDGYRSCDLYLAAFFLSCGLKMVTHERDSKTRRVYFIFEKNPLINELNWGHFTLQVNRKD